MYLSDYVCICDCINVKPCARERRFVQVCKGTNTQIRACVCMYVVSRTKGLHQCYHRAENAHLLQNTEMLLALAELSDDLCEMTNMRRRQSKMNDIFADETVPTFVGA